MSVNIERAFIDEPNVWSNIDEDTFLLRTEWAGVYPMGTALKFLHEKGLIRTPTHLFRLKGKYSQGGTDMKKKAEKIPQRLLEKAKANAANIAPDEPTEEAVNDFLNEATTEEISETVEDTTEIDSTAESADEGKAEPDVTDEKVEDTVVEAKASLITDPSPNNPLRNKVLLEKTRNECTPEELAILNRLNPTGKKPRGYPLGTIRHYKNGEAFRRVEPPKGWEYLGKTGSDKVKKAEDEAKAKGLGVIYDQPLVQTPGVE